MEPVLDKEKQILWDVPSDQELIHVKEITSFEPKPVYEAVKRAFDFTVSLVALAVLLIPMLIIALVIRLDSKGNPIYSQVRLGKDQEPFVLYKFRSMYMGAESGGVRWAADGDSRVTRVGQFLRKTRIDELPQIINILAGQMSFVGPRPERPEFYEVFDTYIIGFRQRMMVKPGLTGLAQVNGGYDLRPEEKIVYDVEYIEKRSFGLDIACIFRTFAVVFGRKGAR